MIEARCLAVEVPSIHANNSIVDPSYQNADCKLKVELNRWIHNSCHTEVLALVVRQVLSEWKTYPKRIRQRSKIRVFQKKSSHQSSFNQNNQTYCFICLFIRSLFVRSFIHVCTIKVRGSMVVPHFYTVSIKILVMSLSSLSSSSSSLSFSPPAAQESTLAAQIYSFVFSGNITTKNRDRLNYCRR